MQKIIRTLTYFADTPVNALIRRCQSLQKRLEDAGFEVQTVRFCCRKMTIRQMAEDWIGHRDFFWSVGALSPAQMKAQMDDLLGLKAPLFFHITPPSRPEGADLEVWREMATQRPDQTFHCAFAFENAWNSPFFPTAQGSKIGFSVGLQPINLADGCDTVYQWKERLRTVWQEVYTLLESEADFLGIDTSIAPMGAGAGSLLTPINAWWGCLDNAILSDFFCDISQFIKHQSPRPVGICGWFFPCLEDAGLAAAYERGQFTTERNLFLSLHSGAGIDTYPIGIDQDPQRMLAILQLVWALATKYHKPLSVRWITDGKTAIGQRTQFKNPYLQEAVIRTL